jgi:hypothetical protein
VNRVRSRRALAVVASLCVAVVIGSTARATIGSPATHSQVHHSGEHPSDHEPGSSVDPLAESDLDVLQGDVAVDELVESGTLVEVAAEAGFSPAELVNELRDDPALFLTNDGLLGYADAFPLDGSELSAEALSAVPPGIDVQALSSKPSASRTLFLDFDGHITADAVWQSVGAPATILSDAFGVGCSTGAPAAVDAIIYEIWQRVSEDFAPFAIDVTTVDPGPGAIVNGQRVVISPTNWVGAGVLGVALLNSFGSGVDRPAFVFSAGASVKTIAEAVSHEAGHTFGLRHDGTAGQEYYDGHGIWAPIMGRSIRAATPVTQWAKGEYASASNTEDDVAGIRSYTGPAADDHGDTAGNATPIAPGAPVGGLIGVGDVDTFVIDVPADATVNVALRPPTPWGNLYATLTLRDPAGAVVSGPALPTAPPLWDTPLSAGPLAAGRYTIAVEPIGYLSPSTGFSHYGSMGEYLLSVGVNSAPAVSPLAPPAPPPPKPTQNCFAPLAPDRLLDTRSGLGGSTRIPAGQTITLQVTGRGGVPTGATAAVLGVVAVDPVRSGFLTMFPCTPTRPTASTLNFVPGQTVANTAITTLSSTGRTCIYAHATTDVVVDVTGWIGPGASARFTAMAPTRVADTRTGLGGVRRLPAGGTIEVDFSSLPSTTRAVALNVTSDAASGPGFATVSPCASTRPDTSTINFVAGDVRPNNTIVGVGANRRVCIYSMTATEIVVDLVGYFGPSGLSYLPATPQRLLDTRESIGYLPASGIVSYRPSVAALGSATAVSAAVNVTATGHARAGFVTTYNCATRPTTSSLNAVVGQVNANGAIVPLASNGRDSCLFTQSGGHLVVDLNGWWVR